VRDVAELAASVRGLKDRLGAQLGDGVRVSTGLPEILTDADRSLLVSRAGVLLVTIQLVVLAAYAVLLSASLLIERRRIDTAMLRSRGAGRWRIVGLTAIEAVVVTVPIADAIAHPRLVQLDSDLITTALGLDISLGRTKEEVRRMREERISA
jgi:hypothetical protein